MKSLIIIFVAILSGCPTESDLQPSTVEICESVATRCRLEAGGVGICTYDSEPKLVCMSQH